MDTRELELIALNQLLAKQRVFGYLNDLPSVKSVVKDLSTGLSVENPDADVVNVNIDNSVNTEETSTVVCDEHHDDEHTHTPNPIIEDEPQETSTPEPERSRIGGKLFQYFKGNNNGSK
jgi:hypothetical protein